MAVRTLGKLRQIKTVADYLKDHPLPERPKPKFSIGTYVKCVPDGLSQTYGYVAMIPAESNYSGSGRDTYMVRTAMYGRVYVRENFMWVV